MDLAHDRGGLWKSLCGMALDNVDLAHHRQDFGSPCVEWDFTTWILLIREEDFGSPCVEGLLRTWMLLITEEDCGSP